MSYNATRSLQLLRTGSSCADAYFREGQEEAIRHIVEGKGRLLLVQRTGWGKSFIYFIATRLLREEGAGPALLISPLLALMRNQISAAERMGVRAATINSDNMDEWNAVEALLTQGKIDILLISPERLGNERFRIQVLAGVAARFLYWRSTKRIASPIGAMISARTIGCWSASSERYRPTCGCLPPRPPPTTA